MHHPVDAALCQQLIRTARVPVGALVACAEAQRTARDAGGPVPFLWELLVERGVMSGADLDAVRRASGDLGAPVDSDPADETCARGSQATRDDRVRGGLPSRSLRRPFLEASGEFLPEWGTRDRDGVGPGDDLGGYEVLEPIGRGSMGCVFVARDRRNARRVALKVLAGERARKGSERFHREARLLCSVQHPNLVRGLAFGSDAGRPFLVMDLIEGPSLKHVICERGPLPEAELRDLGAGLARAVAYLHREGIIHRDIKPANVLIGPDGRARLCDLGLAREEGLSSQATASSDTLGTPCYMSPEQARGPRDVGPPADLYSLGVTLFHAAAGRPPFTEESGIVVLSRHLFDGIPDVRTLRPGLSAGLARLVWRLTRK
ncbi:MAG: serine/threonine protein kinase, partial [Planctomycetes bacterium]|nr:serine/threonine protein kinase [Planctomycetota bacterium]